MIGTVQLVALTAAAFVVLASAWASALVPLALRVTRGWHPAREHRALVVLALSPLVLAVAALGAVLLPSVLALIWPSFDHCLTHDDVHTHLCFTHGARAPDVVIGALAAGALAYAVAVTPRLLQRARRATSVVAALLRHGRFDARTRATVVPVTQPLCLSVGFWRPRVVVSDGLLAAASARALKVMLAHERAHGARRDALWHLIARATTLAMVPRARRALLAATELASERACDERAARRVADRVLVAETLVGMERHLAALRSARVSAFGPSSVPARVEAMLRPPPAAGSSLWPLGALAGLTLALLLAFARVHHETEHLLGLLFP